MHEGFVLQIKQPPVWSSFRYWAYLYKDGVKIADTPVETKWGARRWAKRTKNKYIEWKTTPSIVEETKV